MPKFILHGYELTARADGPVQNLTQSRLEIEPADGGAFCSFEYVPGGPSGAEVAVSPGVMVYDGVGPALGLLPDDLELFQLSADGLSSTILALTFDGGHIVSDGVFALAGDPLPRFAEPMEMDQFLKAATLERLPIDREIRIDLRSVPDVEVADITDLAEEDFVFAEIDEDPGEDEADNLFIELSMESEEASPPVPSPEPSLLEEYALSAEPRDITDDGLF